MRLKEAEIIHQLDILGQDPLCLEDKNLDFEFNVCRERKPVQLFKHEGRNVRIAYNKLL